MTQYEGHMRSEAPDDYFLPAVDAMETEQELVLLADMPGVSPDRLDITVEEGVLTLAGRVEPESAEHEETIQQEFLRGDYYRQFRIPREFQADRIDASVKNGVVTVRIPREERSAPKRIEIRVE